MTTSSSRRKKANMNKISNQNLIAILLFKLLPGDFYQRLSSLFVIIICRFSDFTMPTLATSPVKKISRTDDLLQVAKLTDLATIPTRGSAHAAGYDQYSAYEMTIPASGKGLVKTDIQVKVPHGTYGRVAPRSGLAWKEHIDIGAGVVDEDYRGNLGKSDIIV